jgi:hypothetical protein
MCEDFIKTSLSDYWDTHLAPNEGLDKIIGTADLGQPALKTFLALFGHKTEFEDEGAAVRFLGRATRADDPKILNKLLSWTWHIPGELAKLGNVTQVYTHTANDLNSALESFSQQCSYPAINRAALEYCV